MTRTPETQALHDPGTPFLALDLATMRRNVARLTSHLGDLGAIPDDAVLDVLRAEGAPETVIFHCFSSGRQMAHNCADAGWLLSLSGTVSFKNAHDLREAAPLIPAEQLLVETDAPYLAPGKFRGKRNEPSYVVEIARVLAETRGVSFEEISRQTTENFFRLFDKVSPAAAST